jgi:hypothetical protein
MKKLTGGSVILQLLVVALLAAATVCLCLPSGNQPIDAAVKTADSEGVPDLTGLPIDLTLTLEQAPAHPGQPATVRAEATALSDLHEMELTVTPQAGTPLISGATSWKGYMARRDRRNVDLSFAIPDSGPRKITALATVHFKDGSRLSKCVEIDVMPGLGKVQLSSGTAPVIKTNSRGEKIAEFEQPQPK